MNILTVGRNRDVAGLLKGIASQSTSIKTYRSAVRALIHLQKTRLRYDCVILDKREVDDNINRVYETIRSICQCQILTTMDDESTANVNRNTPKISDTVPSLAVYASQANEQTIESTKNFNQKHVLDLKPGLIEYHAPCARRIETVRNHKPQLRLVTNNTAR